MIFFVIDMTKSFMKFKMTTKMKLSL